MNEPLERPPSFDEDWAGIWNEWVLEHDLPALPSALMVGESVPVARWIGPRFAAVLDVAWWTDDEGEDPDETESDVELFIRVESGWESSMSSGGAGWHEPPLERPRIGPREVHLYGQHCASTDSWSACAVYGIAGEDSAEVEVEDADGIHVAAIESPIGAFVACANGKATAVVRVRDNAGALLFTETFADFGSPGARGGWTGGG